MMTRSRTPGRSTSIRFTPSGTARYEDIKEDIKREKGISDDNRDMYEMYQLLYHMLHLAQNFGFAPFF